MDTFWFISIIVTPTPKIVNYAELPKSSYLLQNKLFEVNYSLFFRQKYFFIPFVEGIYGFIFMK